MKSKILTNKEIVDLLEIKDKKTNKNLKEVFDEIIKIIPDFNYKDNSEKTKLILNIISSGGNIKNNKDKLICPKCRNCYIIEYLYGDVFFRMFNGNKKQKKIEEERFEKMGLFVNISPYGKGKNQKDYCCLSCGNEW